MTIIILDIIHTPNAILHEFGLKVYEALRPKIANDESVILSFKGLRSVNSLFCNASIGKLYIEFPDTIENLLSFDNVTNEAWQESICEAIELAQDPQRAKARDEAIKQLFHKS